MSGDNQGYNPQGRSYNQPEPQYNEPASQNSYGGMNQAKPKVEQRIPEIDIDEDKYRFRKGKSNGRKKKIRKKYCKYTEMKVDFIDYKNTDLLKLSMSERGKIMPRRLTVTLKFTRNGRKANKEFLTLLIPSLILL